MEGATATTSSMCIPLNPILRLPYCPIIIINTALHSPKYFVMQPWLTKFFFIIWEKEKFWSSSLSFNEQLKCTCAQQNVKITLRKSICPYISSSERLHHIPLQQLSSEHHTATSWGSHVGRSPTKDVNSTAPKWSRKAPWFTRKRHQMSLGGHSEVQHNSSSGHMHVIKNKDMNSSWQSNRNCSIDLFLCI